MKLTKMKRRRHLTHVSGQCKRDLREIRLSNHIDIANQANPWQKPAITSLV